jgi:hypothetical protein
MIYHDFHASYRQDKALLALLEGGLTVRKAEKAGVSLDEFENWYREGYIVPTDSSKF